MNQNNNEMALTDMIRYAVEFEKKRYQRKGYGKFIAFIIALNCFTLGRYFQLCQFQALQGYSPFLITNLILITSNILAYLTMNLVCYIIYTIKHPYFEYYRIQALIPWPWESDPAAWKIKRYQVLQNWLVNTMLGSSLSFISCYLFEYHRTDVESFPSVIEMVKQIAFSMIIEDTAVYWIHRSFHHPKLYPWIHKKHHEFYQSISIATEYAHPIEFILQNTLTIIIYAKIVGAQMHLATLQFWLVLRVAEAIETHSGYEFPWSPFRLLPFSSSSECHNYHHSHNIGNFESFFSFWDTICGTNISYIQHRNLIEQEAKKQIEKEHIIQRKQK